MLSWSYSDFEEEFCEVFDHFVSGKDAGEKTAVIQTRKLSAADYALIFCPVAVESGWNEPALKTVFREVLSKVLQS